MLPHEIGLCRELTTLVLAHNQLKEIPGEIGLLTSLTELFLNDNHLSRLPPELSSLVLLKHVTLHGNPLVSPPIEACGTSLMMIHWIREHADATFVCTWCSALCIVPNYQQLLKPTKDNPNPAPIRCQRASCGLPLSFAGRFLTKKKLSPSAGIRVGVPKRDGGTFLCIDLERGDTAVLKRPRESLEEQVSMISAKTNVVREAWNLLQLEGVGGLRVPRIRHWDAVQVVLVMDHVMGEAVGKVSGRGRGSE